MPANMMFQWTGLMVEFMKDASSHSDYHKKLAGLLEPYMSDCTSVCDAGCGLGSLGIQIAANGHEVSCIDINSKAIEVAGQAIRESGLDNVRAFQADLLQDLPYRYDAMVFSYFGLIDQIISIARRLCKRRVLIIKKDYEFHRFSVGSNPIVRNNGPLATKYLDSHGITYRSSAFSLEFGQPFRSLEDAIEFYQIYSRDPDKSVITPSWVKSMLVETNDPVFPYYLAHQKASRLLVIEAKDLGND